MGVGCTVMRLARVVSSLLLVLFSAWVLAPCSGDGPADLRWDIDFKCPGEGARADSILVRVLRDGCGGTDPAYTASLTRGMPGPGEIVSPGDYYLEVTALDSNGGVVTS